MAAHFEPSAPPAASCSRNSRKPKARCRFHRDISFAQMGVLHFHQGRNTFPNTAALPGAASGNSKLRPTARSHRQTAAPPACCGGTPLRPRNLALRFPFDRFDEQLLATGFQTCAHQVSHVKSSVAALSINYMRVGHLRYSTPPGSPSPPPPRQAVRPSLWLVHRGWVVARRWPWPHRRSILQTCRCRRPPIPTAGRHGLALAPSEQPALPMPRGGCARRILGTF